MLDLGLDPGSADCVGLRSLEFSMNSAVSFATRCGPVLCTYRKTGRPTQTNSRHAGPPSGANPIRVLA